MQLLKRKRRILKVNLFKLDLKILEKKSKKQKNATNLKEDDDEEPLKSKDFIESSCQICYEEFESRTKLFKHIRDSGHAVLKTVNEKTKKDNKKKPKKL